jgi:hypothetical protein
MPLLEQLKLVATVERKSLPIIEQRRQKLLEKLAEQIEMAKAQQTGQIYSPLVTRNKVDPATGETKPVTQPKRVRSWWFTTDTGKVCLTIKYGHRSLELAKGKTAIELADQQEVLSTLHLIEEAVKAGELDQAITQATGQLKTGFTKKA